MWLFERKTELDILAENTSGRILVVGPMARFTGGGDPTVPFLIKFLRMPARNIVVIDYKYTSEEKGYERTFAYGALKETKEDVVKELQEPGMHFTVANALQLPFQDNTFDTVIDRMTNQWILDNNRDNAAKALVGEYARILKKGGKIIFFCSDGYAGNSGFYYGLLLKELKEQKLIVKKGKLKLTPVFGQGIIANYLSTHYIVGQKVYS